MIITLLLTACMTPSVAQKKYTLNGTAPQDKNYVYLYKVGTAEATDSIATKNGKFKYNGTFTEPYLARISTTNNPKVTGGIPFLVDGEALTIDMQNGVTKGSELNKKFTQWNKRISAYPQKMDSLNQVALSYRNENKNIPEDVYNKLSSEFQTATNEWNKAIKTCCLENTSNLIPAYFLSSGMDVLSDEEVVELGKETYAYMSSPLLDPMKKNIARIQKTAIGATYMDFSMADTTGTMHKLSEYIGKGYVLLDFWASWCGPCRAEMPHVKAAYETYAPKGFQIVGISLDNKESAWKGAINQMGLPWIHLSDLKGWKCEGAQRYGINSIPATLLLDKDGKIIARNLRGKQLAEKLAEVYQ